MNEKERFGRIMKIKDNTIITDGQNLADNAEELKKSGITDVIIDVNTFNYTRYKESNEGKHLENVIEGINRAVGLKMNIRLNVRLKEGFNDDEVLDFLEKTNATKNTVKNIRRDIAKAEQMEAVKNAEK